MLSRFSTAAMFIHERVIGAVMPDAAIGGVSYFVPTRADDACAALFFGKYEIDK
jgi:hypothetical protein